MSPVVFFIRVPFACHYASCPLSNLRNVHIAVSILGVKSHTLVTHTIPQGVDLAPTLPGGVVIQWIFFFVQGRGELRLTGCHSFER